MISDRASNWVDRGEPAEPKIAKALRHFLGFDAPLEDATLLEYAGVVVGMVAADASEVQVAAYLGHLEDQAGLQRSTARHGRLEAVPAQPPSPTRVPSATSSAVRTVSRPSPTRTRTVRTDAGTVTR